MIKLVKYKNKYNIIHSFVIDVTEEDKKYIFGKRLEDNLAMLIERKNIIEITEPKKPTKNENLR